MTHPHDTLKLASPEGPFLLRTAGRVFSTPSLANATQISRSLIEESGAGASSWSGATVHREGREDLVAVLSYNGRAYLPCRSNPEGRPIPGELEFDLTEEAL